MGVNKAVPRVCIYKRTAFYCALTYTHRLVSSSLSTAGARAHAHLAVRSLEGRSSCATYTHTCIRTHEAQDIHISMTLGHHTFHSPSVRARCLGYPSPRARQCGVCSRGNARQVRVRTGSQDERVRRRLHSVSAQRRLPRPPRAIQSPSCQRRLRSRGDHGLVSAPYWGFDCSDHRGRGGADGLELPEPFPRRCLHAGLPGPSANPEEAGAWARGWTADHRSGTPTHTNNRPRGACRRHPALRS